MAQMNLGATTADAWFVKKKEESCEPDDKGWAQQSYLHEQLANSLNWLAIPGIYLFALTV